MSAPPPFLSSPGSNTGCAAPGRAASHTPPSLPTPALSPLREVPKIPVPLACSLRLRKHRTKHPAEPAMRQGWVWWIAYDLTSQVWRYVLDVDLKASLNDYETKLQALTKAVEAMCKRIDAAGDDSKAKVKEIAELEKQSTSIQPTVDAINTLLA